jgi:hypothetical protein
MNLLKIMRLVPFPNQSNAVLVQTGNINITNYVQGCAAVGSSEGPKRAFCKFLTTCLIPLLSAPKISDDTGDMLVSDIDTSTYRQRLLVSNVDGASVLAHSTAVNNRQLVCAVSESSLY